MTPASYQAPKAGESTEKPKTYSQSTSSAIAPGSVVNVGAVLDDKGRNVISVGPGEQLAVAMKLLAEKRIGVVMVVSDGAMVGILSERDIVRHLAGGGTVEDVAGDVMTPDPKTCGPEDRLIDIMQRMTEGRFRHLPVIEAGALTGMISIVDVVKYRLVELEYEALRMKQMIVG